MEHGSGGLLSLELKSGELLESSDNFQGLEVSSSSLLP
jgi:hypothetical protein